MLEGVLQLNHPKPFSYCTSHEKVKVPAVQFGYGALLVCFWYAQGSLSVRSSPLCDAVRFGSVQCSVGRLFFGYVCMRGQYALSLRARG